MKRILFIVIALFFIISCTSNKTDEMYLNNNNSFNNLVETNAVFKTIYERRSVREFKDKDVDDNIIRILVEAAQWAPSSLNVQSWRFVAVKDTVVRLKIAKTVWQRYNQNREQPVPFNNLKKYLGLNAPVQIYVFNDTRNSKDPHDDAIGCYAAIQNFILAAQSIGLGTCWQSFPVMAKDVTEEILDVPDGFDLVSTIAIGYSNEKPERKERKYNIDEILSFEKWMN